MYDSLSVNQKRILEYNEGTVVVKACPGSGKTYSVAARISRLLKDNDFKKQGIAIISFTNIACVEIEEKLTNEFRASIPLKEPNFLGTIDSFVNNFIFLPFGHLIMGCKERPELVGEPHSSWSVKRHEHDYDQYFDKTTFNISGYLIQIAPYQAFPFTWSYYNVDGSINGHIQKIIDSKNKYFSIGYANQSDANYIAMKVLEKYPLIAENIANKFKYFMIDECTNENN
jgi:DNA helicase II / ATP-dependent DNA helicase PcrA